MHIPAFVSMVMAHKAEPSTLTLLIGFLAKVVSACPSAASFATDGFLLRRRPSVSELETGSTVSDDQGNDQGYLQVLCAVIALSQFDLSRFLEFYCCCANRCNTYFLLYAICACACSQLNLSVVDTVVESTGFSLEMLLMTNLPPLNHELFSHFVRAIFHLIAREADVPDFDRNGVDAVVVASVAAGSLRIRSMPLTDWSDGRKALWWHLFQSVAENMSRFHSESDGSLKVNMKALLALCVLCAYDPKDDWLEIARQQQLGDRFLMNYFIDITSAAACVTRSQ